MNCKILIMAVTSIFFYESCNLYAENNTLNKSESSETIVTVDSIFYYYKEARQLPAGTKAFKGLEVLDRSKLGSLDLYATDITDVFSKSRIEEIFPILLYYVELLFLNCEEYHRDIFNENFDNMPESAQRIDVQSEMNSRKNKLTKAKNILEAILCTNKEDKANAILLYGNVLYNLYEEESAEKAYSEYYNIMKEKGMEKEVPSYVIHPDERKMIDDA